MVVFIDPQIVCRLCLLDSTEYADSEQRMVRHDRTPAFVHDRWMGDAFGIAHVHDVPDHVVRVFLKRIVRGAVEVAP